MPSSPRHGSVAIQCDAFYRLKATIGHWAKDADSAEPRDLYGPMRRKTMAFLIGRLRPVSAMALELLRYEGLAPDDPNQPDVFRSRFAGDGVVLRFDAEDICIPFPQRDVHIVTPGPLDASWPAPGGGQTGPSAPHAPGS